MKAAGAVPMTARRPDAVIVADDSTITIRRDRPWNGRDAWWVTYPEHLLGEVPPAEFFASEFWLRPVGTGPFRYARHVPRTVFELEADPDHFAGRPRIDRRELHRLHDLPEGMPIVDVPLSRRQFRDGKFPPALPHDPERARALLDSAGWREDDGDGMRERGPVAARFTVLLAGGGIAGTGACERMAVYMQAAELWIEEEP